MTGEGWAPLPDSFHQTQVGGLIDNVDVQQIDFIVAETRTSRVAVLRAMIRCCLADADRFVDEWMPKRDDVWEIGGDPYTRDAHRARFNDQEAGR